MAVVEELLRSEANGTISFGDYTLAAKKKVEDYEHKGDLYKVKTYAEITKLEKNGMFLYESVPGTSVNNFAQSDEGVQFTVSGVEDAQLTIGLCEDATYSVFVNGEQIGDMKTNMSGKLSVSVELSEGTEISVKITK